jgi:hypothetical protein
MLLDHRTYTVRPGTLNLQLELYATFGLPAQTRHLGPPLMFLITETGELNTYVHIWAYADAADRMRRRAALQTDPDWLVYAEKAATAGYITRQETKLMTPAFFAPLELAGRPSARDSA